MHSPRFSCLLADIVLLTGKWSTCRLAIDSILGFPDQPFKHQLMGGDLTGMQYSALDSASRGSGMKCVVVDWRVRMTGFDEANIEPTTMCFPFSFEASFRAFWVRRGILDPYLGAFPLARDPSQP